MEYERNFNYLIENRIVWRKDPMRDNPPDETFDWGWYYVEGTHGCYTLFTSRAKINTYKSLKWHLYVLWYINPQLDQTDFDALVAHICKPTSGFITFDIRESLMHKIAYEVSLSDLDRPPPNKLRKVIFRDFCGLTRIEKLQIVGSLVGKKSISESEIYDAMLLMHDDDLKITMATLAKSLKCSERTIYRNMTLELKKEKELLNAQL